MEATIERTAGRITDMYILRMYGIRQIPQRFLAFTRSEWEEMYPHMKLEPGKKEKIHLTFADFGV